MTTDHGISLQQCCFPSEMPNESTEMRSWRTEVIMMFLSGMFLSGMECSK